jgi:ribosomal protein L37AE/L43A
MTDHDYSVKFSCVNCATQTVDATDNYCRFCGAEFTGEPAAFKVYDNVGKVVLELEVVDE